MDGGLFRIRIFKIMGDLRDCDDAEASFSPSPRPSGLRIKSTMTVRGHVGWRFQIPRFARNDTVSGFGLLAPVPAL